VKKICNHLITPAVLLAIALSLAFYIDTRKPNPIVPFVGMADPHIHIFNGKAYLYATRDADSTAKEFVMPDWKIWSSDDLINWKLERTIDPTETYMGKSDNCWATDVAFKNGFYYYYFSNGNLNTGVMKSKSPAGPFIDALGKSMLDQSLTTGKEYDPTVLVDDDKSKTGYIAFGHYVNNDPNLSYYIAKLDNDMISIAEAPKKISITGDADVLKANDKPNLHKRNGIYYLSAGSHYATSKNIFGPYTRIGNSGNNKYGLTERAHGNYFQWKNQWFHTWCHFYLGKDVARYRESYISYLHYKNNGEMVTDAAFLDAHFLTGVGQYDTSWDKIEAEWYMAANKVEKRESVNGGFEIQNVKNGGYLNYPNIKNLNKAESINFYLSSNNSDAIIEVHGNTIDGKLLGFVKIGNTGGFGNYKNVNCTLKNTIGVKGIYLKFKGSKEDLLHLDWFKFN
jgi:arabinoxylan arabinofuranohydrolase